MRSHRIQTLHQLKGYDLLKTVYQYGILQIKLIKDCHSLNKGFLCPFHQRHGSICKNSLSTCYCSNETNQRLPVPKQSVHVALLILS